MPRRAVKFKFEFSKITFDTGGFTKAFDEKAARLVRMAARAWLRALILQIPVWTGFALGSVKFAKGSGGNLGKYLNVAIPISPRSRRPRFYYHRGGRRTPKTPERAGTYSEYNFPSGQWRYRFSFRSDVIHFILNEFYASVSPSSPWLSMNAGRRAFLDYMKEHVKDLPKVKDYVIKSPDPRRKGI